MTYWASIGLHLPCFALRICMNLTLWQVLPRSSVSKETAFNAGDLDSIPGSCRSPGEGKRTQLQYSCLENPMDRGKSQAVVHGLATKPSPTLWQNQVEMSFLMSVVVITQSCPTHLDPMDCSMSGFPLLHKDRVCSNSCPSSQWCHATISSCRDLLLLPSVLPSIRVFSNKSALHIGGQSIGESA